MHKPVLILLFISAILSKNYASTYFHKNDSLRFASDDSIKYFIETKLHYGFIIAHHKSMEGIVAGHFPAFELNVDKQTHGENSWQPLYKYPVIGLSFWYAELANPGVLGSVYAIYPYLNFHLYQDDYFQFNFRFGTGLGYLTKKFDRIDNYKDIAIGSHLNAALNLFYELKWIISKRVLVSGSIGLSHFSNGLIKTPNLGINIPTVSVGMAYIFHNNSTIISHVDTAFHKKKQKLNIQLFASGGIKQISLPGGSYYGIYTLSACFLKPLSKKREIGIGFDIFWDLSNVQTIEYNGFTVNHAYDVIKPGIYIGHQFDFSHFSIITQIGYYLYVKDKYVEPIYTRFALRYLFSNRIMLNLALLTHYATADFIEWGIGYSLK